MDAKCLQFHLTETERRHMNEQGYVIVPDALDRAACDRLIAAVDRVDGARRTLNFGRERLLSFANILPEDGAVCRFARLAAGISQSLGHPGLEHLRVSHASGRVAASTNAAEQSGRLASGQHAQSTKRSSAIRGHGCRSKSVII